MKEHARLSVKLAKQLCVDGQLQSAQRFLETALTQRKSAHVMVALAHVLWLQQDVEGARTLLHDTLGLVRDSAAAKILARILALEISSVLQPADAQPATELRSLLDRFTINSPCGWAVLAQGYLAVAASCLARGQIDDAKVLMRYVFICLYTCEAGSSWWYLW